jgi:hypothetical protein
MHDFTLRGLVIGYASTEGRTGASASRRARHRSKDPAYGTSRRRVHQFGEYPQLDTRRAPAQNSGNVTGRKSKPLKNPDSSGLSSSDGDEPPLRRPRNAGFIACLLAISLFVYANVVNFRAARAGTQSYSETARMVNEIAVFVDHQSKLLAAIFSEDIQILEGAFQEYRFTCLGLFYRGCNVSRMNTKTWKSRIS